MANSEAELARILAEKEERRLREVALNREAEAPILAALAAVGINLTGVAEYYNGRDLDRAAVPILMEWLPKAGTTDVKEGIVRALTDPKAREAAPLLIAEFRRAAPSEELGLKWTIGNALSVVGDDRVGDELLELAQDRSHGRAREMVAEALGNLKKRSRALEVLIDLLSDEDVAGHAVVGLGKLKAAEARPYLERFLSHPKRWIRVEAKRALARINRAK